MMEDLLRNIVKTLGYPVIRQGSLAPDDAYPDSFFTYWNNSADGDGYFDNDETRTVWNFDLNFYSTDADLTYSKLLEAKELLKKQHFIINGKGYDAPSDEITHTGRGISVLYIEKN